ncbi:MAG TPA: radical SAM protein, partial [Elusimicrobiales bacterium]|nr:radical SAM protein [Elusimicrobiales bacterium]
MADKLRAPQFDWCSHYRCDMNCTYCWFHAVRHTLEPANYYPGTAAVLQAWERIALKYGECEVSVGGGEPMLYPDCAALYSEMSRLHKLSLTTNLSRE